MDNLLRLFQKLKKEMKKKKRLSFITQFKIEFLLLFIGYRKELAKMPEIGIVPVFLTLSQTHRLHASASCFGTKFDLHECT